MSLPPLAIVDDVQARLPATFTIETARATVLIKDASSVVRKYTKQDFTLGQTTEEIRPIGYRLKLTQEPVISVDGVSVRLPMQATLQPFPAWWWPGGDEVWLLSGDQVINLAEEVQYALRWMTPMMYVKYTHGYDVTPDDVTAVVCSMVIRTLTAPGLGGVVSESVGEYSYRLSDAAAQGTMAMTEAEKEALKHYRPKPRSAELRSS